jgi:hypothetical protein
MDDVKDTIVCKKCLEELPTDEFYFSFTKRRYFTKCKGCSRIEDREKKARVQLSNGGAARAPRKPGEFNDEEQKRQVFEFLQLIGWKHNPNKNIWYNNKHRDKDGNWLITFNNKKVKVVKPKPKPKDKSVRFIPFDELPKIKFEYAVKHQMIPQDVIDDVVYRYYNKLETTTQVCEAYPQYPYIKIVYIIGRVKILNKKKDGQS